MKDFIFGTLATEELRFKHVRSRRAGVSHSHRRVPRDPLPGQNISIELSVGPDHPCEDAYVYWSTDGTDPLGQLGTAIRGHVTHMQPVSVEWDTVLWGYIRNFRGVIPGQAAGNVVRYYLSVVCEGDQEVIADHGTLYAFYVDDDPLPAWTRDAVVYQIFVDRFNPGKGKDWLTPKTPAGFYGGTIRGITEKLDYLIELGVNTLWLTPIFPSPSHHGYDATDLLDIEPRLGSKTDLRDLLDESHRQGIRVLLDLVPNHVSNLHPSFQSAISDQNSPFVKWFSFTHWPDKYLSFFDVPDLPQLNLREPAARKHLLEAAACWLDFGVDGYRVDYALGPTPDFWADFRRVTRRARPDCWTFGEVVEPPESQINFAGSLDGCLDFNLLEAFRMLFAFRDWNPGQFASYLERHEAYFPEDFSRPSFLDNHDMNRFLWAAGGDLQRLRLAALCQFTLMGPPIIYYGTEVGLSQIRDVRQGEYGLPEESRLPMLWGKAQNRDLFEYYQTLVKLRHKILPFKYDKAIIHQASQGLLVYSKTSSDKTRILFNLSDSSRAVEFENPIIEILFETDTGSTHLENGGINLAPMSAAVIVFS